MEAKIGVFTCDCGGSIKNVDFSIIKKKIAKIPHVVIVSSVSNLCLDEGKEELLSCIKNNNINRVVIAACSPEFKGHIFQQLLEKAGLNSHLLSMANIREQCAWVHEGDVTEKALELIRMAVNEALLLQPLEKREFAVNKEVLVVGGGFWGINSALQLSRVGLRATLLEREADLGGVNREFEALCGLDMSSMIKAVHGDRNIEIITSAEITRIEGQIGDFSVRVMKGAEEIRRSFGALVFATGHRVEPIAPDSQFKDNANIISQHGFAQMLQSPTAEPSPKTVGFVVGFSDENSRFPTLVTLNNALASRQKWGSETYVFCKNVQVDSEGVESLYRETRDQGVVFVKSGDHPKISIDKEGLKVEAEDILVGEEVSLTCNLLVTDGILLPAEGTEALSSLLSMKTDSRGFHQDENVYFYPVGSNRKGVFFVGDCRGNIDPNRALADVSSVVMSVYELLSRGKVVAEVERVKVDPQKCRACLTCIRACPHSSIRLVRMGSGNTDGEKEVAEIFDPACDGCGICTAICPAKAIKFEGYSDEQILAQVEMVGAS